MMKLCVLTIKPESGFGTPLKGDTLFGHFCWQASHHSSLVDGGLEKWITGYLDTPYAVFSSAYPKLVKEEIQYVLKRPDLPIPFWPREKAPADRKDFKRKKWMLAKEDLAIDLNSIEILADEEMEIRAWDIATAETKKIMKMNQDRRFTLNTEQPHDTHQSSSPEPRERGCSLPYSENVGYFYPDSEVAVFILFDEKATDLDRISRGMEMIGRWGYGKDASIGQGKFSLGKCEEIAWPQTEGANACYTLAPLVPEKEAYQEYFFTPFIRFGKHGDLLARSATPSRTRSSWPTKDGIYSRNGDAFEKPYIGRGLTGLSKAMPESVGQGYSIYLPFRMEMRHE